MANLPIFAPVKTRNGSLSRDPFLKNAFVEPFGKEGMHVFKRPGLAIYSTNSAGAGQGLTSYRDPDDVEYLFNVTGGKLYNNSAQKPEGRASVKFNPTTAAGNKIGSFTGQSIARIGNTMFLVGSTFGFTRFIVFYSQDGGATWTELLDVAAGGSYPAGFERCWVTAHNGKIVLLLGSIGGHQVWESANGVTWTQICANWNTASKDASWAHVESHAGNLFMFTAASSSPVYRSTDNGVTWAVYGTIPWSTRTQAGVCSDGTYLYYLSGVTSTNRLKVYRSADGNTWSEHGTNAMTGVLTDSTPGNASALTRYGGLFYLYNNVEAATATMELWVSADALTWYLLTTLTSAGGSGDPTDMVPTTGGITHCPGTFIISQGRVNILWCNGTAAFGTVASVSLFSHAFTSGGPPVLVGDVGNGKLDFSQNYARTLLAVKSQTKAYSITVPGSVITPVTDVDYPERTARGLVYLDGYFFVMDTDGNIFGSAAEDFTNWSALNFIAAEFEPDGGVALCKYLNYVVAFGNYTTEFFYNAGNAVGSPLSPVQNGVLTIGCADGDTVQTIDSVILWVAQTKTGGQSAATGRFVAKLNGTNYEKLSTPDIDRLLDADDFTDVDATAFKVGGHSYYHIRLGSSKISLVFDLGQSQWYVWGTRRNSFTRTLAGVVTANGTATWTGTHSFADGDVAVISAFTGTHTALNGTHNVTVPATNTLMWRPTAGYSGTSTGTGTATGWTEDDFPVTYACDFQGQQILQDKSNGTLYVLDGNTYRDGGKYMDWIARLEKTDGDTNNSKFAAWADFISDRAPGNVLLRVSDDDGQTWTKYKAKSLAGQRTRWNRLGSFRRRLHELRVTDNIPVRAERLELSAIDDEAANG